MEQEQIAVTYSASDILALNVLIWRFWLSLILVVTALVILIPVFLALLDGYRLGDSLAAIDWTFTGFLVAILVLWLLAVTSLTYWWRRRRGLHGPILFALAQDGLSFRNRQMSGLVFWTAIKSIRMRGPRLFLFVTGRSALILPRRAFDSDDEFKDFAVAAEERWEKQHRV